MTTDDLVMACRANRRVYDSLFDWLVEERTRVLDMMARADTVEECWRRQGEARILGRLTSELERLVTRPTKTTVDNKKSEKI
jgi:hypothetical protein